MSTVSYKCPNCGGGLKFNPELQKSKCEFCLSEFTDEELALINQRIAEAAAQKGQEQSQEGGSQTEDQKVNLYSYTCNNCGAEVVSDEDTSATFCYYCHNPVLVTGRLIGDFAPDKIIPFAINKEKAKKNFLSWAKSHMFVPVDFYSSSQLEKMTGLYQPYWLADLQSEVNYQGKGTNIRTWRAGKRQYTETKIYSIVKSGTIGLANVPAIAVDRIEKKLLELITPYEDEKAIDFSMSYLSGFFAEKYSYTKEELRPVIEDLGRKCNQQLVEENTGHYQQLTWLKTSQDIEVKNWYYALFPAWILTYKYNGNNYVYAVNGQTGKAYGELPLNKKKLALFSVVISAVVFAGSLLGGMFLW